MSQVKCFIKALLCHCVLLPCDVVTNTWLTQNDRWQQTKTWALRPSRNAVSSGEKRLNVPINNRRRCTESRSSKGAERGSGLGHDSIVTAANELMTRERGDWSPPPLCGTFALNTLISELWKRHRIGTRERVVLGQVSVGLARTSLGWINIRLCLLKSLNLAN